MLKSRVTFLTTPEFKARLEKMAADEGVNMSELIRSKFDAAPDVDALMIAELASELRQGVTRANASLDQGLASAQAAIEALRAERRNRDEQAMTAPAAQDAPPRRAKTRRKAA